MARAEAHQLLLFDTGVNMTQLRSQALELVESGRAARGSSKTYDSQWRVFIAWCESAGRCELPASEDTVSCFLAGRYQEGKKLSTLRLSACAIRAVHVRSGHPSPVGD